MDHGDYNFGGIGDTSAVMFWIDPDGKYSGTTNGPGKAVHLFMYYDGSIKSRGNIFPQTGVNFIPNTYYYDPDPSMDPPWFRWD